MENPDFADRLSQIAEMKPHPRTNPLPQAARIGLCPSLTLLHHNQYGRSGSSIDQDSSFFPEAGGQSECTRTSGYIREIAWACGLQAAALAAAVIIFWL
jgi:hypothetical protein